ncbi:serine/threonine-protein kinase pim-1-like [Centroberyx affinis]|uniref:serine/threonine-protein kinase pim-1-like n=1 Tax=Centroberyx affinis TaxID=166261 RepID=UPI003A5C55C9
MAFRSIQALKPLGSLGSKRDQGSHSSPAAIDNRHNEISLPVEDAGAEAKRKKRRKKRKASSEEGDEARKRIAIKHIPMDKVVYTEMSLNGEMCRLPLEVLLQLKAGSGAGPDSVGTTAAVTLLDWFELPEELILVLERPVPSTDLINYLEARGDSIREGEAKTIMKQLVDAAAVMHSEGVFHRDIKLDNVLIEGFGEPRVRIIDFGCGCILKPGAYTEAPGTLQYTPPEWFKCCSYEAGPATVWQLGVTMYAMLAGYLPFDTKQEIVQNCQHFLQCCLDKSPERRPTLEHLQLHPWLH